MQCDVWIRGGEVLDPSQQLREQRDVLVRGDRIVTLEAEPGEVEAEHIIDARNLLVVPGLIDLHVHVYPHSPFGLEPDPLCPAGGVTTMVDTGTAGSFQFGHFRREVIDRVRTQILGLVNLSCMGLSARNLGELLDPRYADPEGVLRTIEDHPGVAVGVKIRAGKHLIGTGQQGWDHFLMAVKAARDSGTWLMVHIGECPMKIPEIVEHLAPGDCITHCYKGGGTRIIDEEDLLFDAVVDAAERGVVFDVGHGSGSFQWEVAEASIAQGLPPTTISTDLHTANLHGPVYDMPTTMSKFLMLGIELEKTVEMSTTQPAQVLGLGEELGTLKVGTKADITVLERRTGRFVFEDSYDGLRVGEELLQAAVTLRAGEIVPGGSGLRMRRLEE
ncbi:MAG: amidohydrolase/deacetylase family metallohydrolase [Candidatus Latescibacterota bacterium]|nr:amidohydrolase/deacetylase family metallohydrolase [Candidatus Latescibacterota bacterium]